MEDQEQLFVEINSWAGRTRHRLMLIKKNRVRSRFKVLDAMPKAPQGQEKLIPNKYVFRLLGGKRKFLNQ